jgi:TolB-like protein/DNA-binding winged helix-turn-helix (wHTH) protein
MLVRPRQRLVRFGVFEFDSASCDLWKAGRRIRLQHQPRQVIRMLLARPGELVTRDDLRRELWPDDTFVDFDNGLNVAVRKIREALGDVVSSPRFIETERAQGYRFIAPVSQDDLPASLEAERASAIADREGVSQDPPAAPPPPGTRPAGGRLRVAAAGLAIVVVAAGGFALWRAMTRSTAAVVEPAGQISLAVLPLSAAGGSSEEFLAVGIADAIITRLSNVRQFRVRSTSAVARYHGDAVDAQSAGRSLESQYVLAGTIRAAPSRVRISVQLVRTSDGSPIWGDRYDVARNDLLTVEDDLAEKISNALRIQLSDAERERVYRRYTRNAAAYERYLMGRSRLRALTEDGARQAIAEFEAARDLDPRYALAHAGMATAAAQLRVRFATPDAHERWDNRAREEAARALQLDPDLAEAHAALAAVHRFQEYDWDTVISQSRRALELNPSLELPHLYLAVAFFHLGLLDEAVDEVRAARELNPGNRIEPLEILGAVSLFDGRIDEALGHLSQLRDLTDSRIVTYLLGWTLYYKGDQPRAESMLGTLVNDEGPVPGNARATLAALRAARGATAEARALAEGVAREPRLIHHAAYGLGTAYAQLGDPETAVRWLSRAAATGFPCFPWFDRDPLLNPIRRDARFTVFMGDLRRSWENARARFLE